MKNKKCKHPSAVGVESIYEELVGLCVDCGEVHSRNTGRKSDKFTTKIWLDMHPQEAINFNAKEYRLK